MDSVNAVPGDAASIGHMAGHGLPAVLVLAPYRTVLHRGHGAVQLGLGPVEGIEVRGLTGELIRMLVELERPVPTVVLLDRYSPAGAAREEATALLALLIERGAVVDAAALRQVESVRRTATLVVSGDGPLAVGVGIALAAAGVGTVYVAADGTVCGRDLGCGYLPADTGRPRWVAAAEAVRAAAPGQVRTGQPPPRLVPDLAVLTDAAVPVAGVVDALLARRVPHLAVRLRDGSGVIGPLVLPGRTSCLRCLDLQRAAQDPGWPLVAAQLTGRAARPPRPASAPPRRSPPSRRWPRSRARHAPRRHPRAQRDARVRRPLGRAAAPAVDPAPGLRVWRSRRRMRRWPGAGDNQHVTDIPRRGVQRTAKLASIPIGLASRAAAGWGRRLVGGDGEEIRPSWQPRAPSNCSRCSASSRAGR